MNNKLKNIYKGWTSEDTEMSKERSTDCFGCKELNNSAFAKMMKATLGKDTCGICGCAVIEKSRVEEEECPIKKWKMEITNKQNVALSLESPDYVEFELKDDKYIMKFKDVPVSNKEIKFELFLRNNTKAILSNLKLISSCGCTLVSEMSTTLSEGKKTMFSLVYKINPKHSKVNKTVFIQNEGKIIATIKIEGNVRNV